MYDCKQFPFIAIAKKFFPLFFECRGTACCALKTRFQARLEKAHQVILVLGKMTIPISDNYCFVCGQNNPRGLKISVRYREADLAAETQLSLPKEYQGWADVIHGGILATLLDEMMAHAVWHFAGPGLTLSLEVRFHAPLKPDEPILVRGVLQSQNGSRRLAAGEIIRLADNTRIASGKSRFLLSNEPGG
jgi:acyl-coenzyme A thioesterase PaaI-like protein